MGLIEFEVKDIGKQLVKDDERISSLYSRLLEQKKREKIGAKEKKNKNQPKFANKYEEMRHKLKQKSGLVDATLNDNISASQRASDFEKEAIEPDLQYFYKQYADFFKNPLGSNQPLLLI